MFKKILISVFGLIVGLGLGFLVLKYSPLFRNNKTVLGEQVAKSEIIGFLPYWLLDKASDDYSKYVTQLAYFAVRVGGDGHIQKFTSPTQSEPGYYALKSGKLDKFFQIAKDKGLSLSIVVDAGDTSSIDKLVSDPINNADNLVEDLNPLLTQYGFSDVNLDIEYVNRATGVQRENFTTFVSEVKKKLPDKNLTVEVANGDSIKPSLIDVSKVGGIADHVVLMAYDFHFSGSFVSGPVAPVSGAEVESEYDVTTSLNNTLNLINNKKLILGIPLYGYEWETLGDSPRTSTVPNSGLIVSSRRAEDLIENCSNCKIESDDQAQEKYIIYYDSNSLTNHIIFFPDQESTSAKINLVKENSLGGIALWALGYEGSKILAPIADYKATL